jgi:hypothetical protein
MDDTDSLIYSLSSGDLSKVPAIESMSVELAYNYYYLNQVSELNKQIAHLEELRKLDKLKH